MMSQHKVFGIGFHKTATKSLGRALEILGYRVCGPVGVKDPKISSRVWDIVTPYLSTYDAFQDNPWPMLFKELDEKYPNSKFILTVRDEAQWLESIVGHFGGTTTPMREWIYGVGDPIGSETVYLRRFRDHNHVVFDYFKKRSRNLLVMDVTKAADWSALCAFLDKDIPDIAFPFLNPRDSRLDKSN